MVHALVLNASFEPLHLVSWQKALQLLFQGKVEVIEESEKEIRTVRLTIRIPAVLRLLEYVPLKKKKRLIRFSRPNVLLRDHHRCQYCGLKYSKAQLTLDHVIPVVQGGGKNWKNIVTACKPCNQKKGGRTPAQAKMNLIRAPREPEWLPRIGIANRLEVGLVKLDESWKPYFRLRSGEQDEQELDPTE